MTHKNQTSVQHINMDAERIACRLSDECDCPEEDWIIGMAEVMIHLEPDGTGHGFFDFGDWDYDIFFPVKTIEELRAAAIKFVSELPPTE